jgi:hypothetical protein
MNIKGITIYWSTLVMVGIIICCAVVVGVGLIDSLRYQGEFNKRCLATCSGGTWRVGCLCHCLNGEGGIVKSTKMCE